MVGHYDVAAFIWPAYHHDPRMEDIWTEGDGEWMTVRNAKPRFDGHNQPRVPLLGYQDEADPGVMGQHAELALEHGVNVFIMDWYWYEDSPFLERQLNEGLMPAIKGTGMKFYLMWANHDAGLTWDPTTDDTDIFWRGAVDRETFERIARRWIESYFSHDNYYKIDGCPVLCLYDLPVFVDGLGGIDEAKRALSWFRTEVKEAGYPGLHLQNTYMGHIPGDILSICPDLEIGPSGAVNAIGFDSVTRYQWVHVAGAQDREYSEWGEIGVDDWDSMVKRFGGVVPHVSVGWDNNPRFPTYREIVRDESPELFEGFLRRAKGFLDTHPEQHRLVTVNSWNEWTEGSYLLPDERSGYGFLEAVKAVFGDTSET